MKKLSGKLSEHDNSQRVGRLIAQRIKNHCSETGMSITDLAQQSGIGITQINNLENGIDEPTILICLKLASILKVKLSDIIREIEIDLPG